MNIQTFLAGKLAAPVQPAVRAIAQEIARNADAEAVLFYGSNLRTGSLDGVLDFYILTSGPRERGIWPTVSYREFDHDSMRLRAKIATMRLATFTRAAADKTIDTTIWARFTQPSALIWTRNAHAERRTIAAIAQAASTAGRYAAALGPESGRAADYWQALFKATYTAELRVERNNRHAQIVENNPDYYERLLPLAWDGGMVPFQRAAGMLEPMLSSTDSLRLKTAWRLHWLAGKPLNIARLLRASFTFEGAARYGAWKIERHTGVPVALTPWRERHPVLAAPGVLWRVWRSGRN